MQSNACDFSSFKPKPFTLCQWLTWPKALFILIQSGMLVEIRQLHVLENCLALISCLVQHGEGKMKRDSTPTEFELILITHNIIPDVIRSVPKFPLQVRFGNKQLEPGGVLSLQDCLRPPTITWEIEEDRVYTIIMTDIDCPMQVPTRGREWKHWIVVNIPEDRIRGGDTITEWLGLTDDHLKNWHRYVIFLFRHESYIYMKFDEVFVNASRNEELRRGFNTLKFAKEYHLGDPLALTFFYAGNSALTPSFTPFELLLKSTAHYFHLNQTSH